MNLLINMKDINKILAKTHFKCKYKNKMWKKNIFLRKHVSMTLLEDSLSCLHFSLMVSEGEYKSPCFLQVWWALGTNVQLVMGIILILKDKTPVGWTIVTIQYIVTFYSYNFMFYTIGRS